VVRLWESLCKFEFTESELAEGKSRCSGVGQSDLFLSDKLVSLSISWLMSQLLEEEKCRTCEYGARPIWLVGHTGASLDHIRVAGLVHNGSGTLCMSWETRFFRHSFRQLSITGLVHRLPKNSL
jgi:hypothetical protein